MRFALFHNLAAGGGKRHLFEQVKELHRRGHTLDLFAPASAAQGDQREYLPLAPFCRNVHVYGTAPQAGETPGTGEMGMKRFLARNPFLRPVADLGWALRTKRQISQMSSLYADMARDIDGGGYDAAYVNLCGLMLAPDLLRFIEKTPTVFCCNDTLRTALEWTPETASSEYDTRRGNVVWRKTRGQFLSPAQVWFQERQLRQFIENTRRASLVLANSWYERECLLRVAGVNATVCEPGADPDFFCPDDAVPRENLVLSVGALAPAKRHDFILRAVGRLPLAQRPAVEIIGYEARYGASGIGPEGRRLTHLACEMGVEMTLGKEVSDDTLRDAYRRASVVAFAPYLEPFGLVPLEAQACETPVVGVREGGVRDTIIDGETGFLTALDEAEFAHALARLLTDPHTARRMGTKGREVVEAQRNWRISTDCAESALLRTAQKGRV